MTIEQLTIKVGAPNVTALQAKLNERKMTVSDVINCEEKCQELRNEFASDCFSEYGSALAQSENLPNNWKQYDQYGPIT